MFDLIANLLSYFYDLNNSYVVAIILLTLVVLIVSTPLTLSGTKSMLKMQLLQPELKAIQNKYGKDEREAMNAEMMEFYKDNQINPVGGCLPMLFQIPVFLVLYRVIIGITRRATDVGTAFGGVTGGILSGSTPQLVESDAVRPFNPAYVSQDSQLYEHLSTSTEMESLGFDLARSASGTLSDGLVTALPYLVLVLVVGVSGWFQHQMIRKRQTGAAINPTQEMIMKFMPFFLPIFAFSLPAAIVFYFLVSNLYRIAQQFYITRSMYHGEDSLGGQLRSQRNNEQRVDSKGASGKKKSPVKKKSSGAPKKGAGANGGKTGRHKSATSTATRTSSPGRNTSGAKASARGNVQTRARKKKR